MNKFETRPVKEKVVIDGSIQQGKFSVKKEISYADHPLVVGPRYKQQDIELHFANEIDTRASGLVVAGLGPDGTRLAEILEDSNFVRSYEVRCKFGRATDNFFDYGRTLEKSTFKHIHKSRLDFTCSKILSMHRKMIFKTSGVDMNSQDAFELAAAGPTRPITFASVPLLYSLKCTHFDPPEFTLRIQTINENAMFIGELVNGIGIKNRSTACITSLRCTRYGHFTFENCLLEKEFNVESVIKNVVSNEPLTSEEKLRPLRPNLYAASEASKKNLLQIIEENKDKFTVVNKPVPIREQ